MKRWKTIILFLMFGIALLKYGRMDVSADTVTGKLGTNITWKLENGVLTISGKGDMLDCKHKKISTWEGDISCGYDYYEQLWGRTMEEQEAIKKVVIENGITSIAAHAFSYCCNLETIVIPDSVTRIEHAAFHCCYSLRQIRIPDKVTAIEDYTFDGCSLEKVKLPKKLKKIGYQAFDGCRDLKEISIPQNVEIIEEKAFEYCEKLKKVTWEGKSRLREIKKLAFQDCDIKKLTIPASVTKIANGSAIGGAYEIKVEKGNKKYKSKNGVVFTKDGKTLVRYPKKKKGSSYKIPNGVRTIGDSAFDDLIQQKGYQYLKKITMPDSVRVIKSHALEGLSELESIRFSKNLKRIEERSLGGYPISSLKLPDSLVYIGEKSIYFRDLKGTLIIPKNVKEIARNGIDLPPNVKKVVIKSKKFKKLSKKAFCSDAKKVTIVLPKSKKSAYKKLFTKKRLGKKMKFIYK